MVQVWVPDVPATLWLKSQVEVGTPPTACTADRLLPPQPARNEVNGASTNTHAIAIFENEIRLQLFDWIMDKGKWRLSFEVRGALIILPALVAPLRNAPYARFCRFLLAFHNSAQLQ